jgi:hypothetical protein
MQERPHKTAWDKLKSFLRGDIDNLSGWSKSWRKSRAERDQVFHGEDGNYYMHREGGILVQVIGDKTLEETRLDFITDHLVHSYGFLHQFVALFALFAIADDYVVNCQRYPLSMKAVLPGENFYHVLHYWHCSFFDRTRTIRWRPDPNTCDPDWLIADLLGEITDTLQVDHWRTQREEIHPDDSWIESTCPFQSDYILDSGLRLGPTAEVIFEFEGKKFRWFNGTAERNAVISMGVRDLRNQEEESASLNRLLTALVWQHKAPIRKLWGVGGPRRPFPTAYGPRLSGAIQVDPAFVAFELRKPRTERQWFALALFREAISSRSRFYSFLCFWKIIELEWPKPETRKDWVNHVAPAATREKESLAKILQNTGDLDDHFRKARRDAVAHVFQEKRHGSTGISRPVNPDDPKHEAAMVDDTRVIEDFARLAIEGMLK